MRTILLLLLCVGALGCNRPTTGRVAAIGKQGVFLNRHEQFLAEGRRQNFDVICLGDSLTWGWDNHRKLWKDHVTTKPTAFWAIGGDATNQLLWRIEHGELDGQNPKLIILLIGTNNVFVNNDAEDTAQSIAVVVQTIQARCPKSKLLLLGLLPQGHAKSADTRLMTEKVNLRLPSVASVRGVVFHNLEQALLDPDGSLSTAVSYDGTHLTERGYRKFAEALGPIVRELLKDES